MWTRSKTTALAVVALIVSSIAVAHTDGIYNPTANSVGDTQGINSNAAVSGTTCTPSTPATNFLARTSGLSAAETKATCTYINALVTAGLIDGTLTGAAGCGATLEGAYFLATKDKTTAYLNICGTSFGAVETVTVTCTVDIGCAGDGSAGFLNTQWTPSTSAVVASLNSLTIGAYIQSTVAVSTAVAMGAATSGGSSFSYMVPVQTGSFFFDINAATFPSFANANPQGAWVVSRTAVTTTNVYKNGSTTAVGTSADTSVGLPSNLMLLFAVSGAATSNFSNYQISCAFFGKGLTSTQAVAANNACNAAMTTYGSNHIY